MHSFLSAASVSKEIFELRPDYRTVLVVAEGLRPQGLADEVEEFLQEAESEASAQIAQTPVSELPHISQWRDAYRGFGAKPSDFKCSAEALIRRAPAGLPRINPLTDLYNALSVKYQTPIGGENLAAYQGPARLVLANGTEAFDTVNAGEPVVENPKPAEAIWRDDLGVTCRRWNWRQCQRTALGPNTSEALFILDALAAVDDDHLAALTEELLGWLERFGAKVASREIRA